MDTFFLDNKQRGAGAHDVCIPAGKRSERALRVEALHKKWEFLVGQEMFILWTDNNCELNKPILSNDMKFSCSI